MTGAFSNRSEPALVWMVQGSSAVRPEEQPRPASGQHVEQHRGRRTTRDQDSAGPDIPSIEMQWMPTATGAALLQSALSRVQAAVRAQDRVCPFTANRLVVEFGPVGDGVPPQVLGYRLAQALARDLPSQTRSSSLAVSVGMATPRLISTPRT